MTTNNSRLKIRAEQDTLAILDDSEAVNFYCIRFSDGMAVIERESIDNDGKCKYKFEVVEPTRIRRISHKDMIPLKEIFEFVKERGL